MSQNDLQIVFESRRSIHAMSMVTRALRDRLLLLKVGEVVSYEQLSKIAGYDVQQNRSHLYSACRNLLNSHEYVIKPVRGEGMKRLDDPEKIAYQKHNRKVMRKRVRRNVKELATVDIRSLSPEDRAKYNVEITMAGLMHEMCKDRTYKQIEAQVKETAQQLTLRQCLENVQQHLA